MFPDTEKDTSIESTVRIRQIRRGDSDYPERLLGLPDPPATLYVKGRIPEGAMVAVVGTRGADQAMCRFSLGLARDLSARGLAVISGGALGIDTAAHKGALEAGGATVSVVGSGFDHMYPEANRDLFLKIAECGALVTEFAPEQPPSKWTFPRRNRLVAAMASAVVVVQAGEGSGALITARIARELGVPVGAVPGNPTDARSRGVNKMLREGAVVVESADDVLPLVERSAGFRQLRLPDSRPMPSVRSMAAAERLSGAGSKIWGLLGSQPMHIDDIAVAAEMSASETIVAVTELEVAGLAVDQGGRNFVKVG